MSWDVVVIGAGVAGLAAARMLAEAGRTVMLLEARERCGGRILTRRQGGEVIELGAEFIHGRPPELWALIAEAGLATYERTGEFLERDAAGNLTAADAGAGDDALPGLAAYAGPDCSFAEYIAGQPLSEAARRAETAYVEGFNAADARAASVLALARQQRAEDEIQGELSWRLRGGYTGLIEYLRARVEAAGGLIRTGAPVTEIAWGPAGASLQCGGGETVTAAKVIVTLPLGVLQTRAVRFVPEPADQLAAAARMRMGTAWRATMVFRHRIWPAEMSFLLARKERPGVWWTAHPEESLTLTGWVGGPRAAQLQALDATALRDQAVHALAAALDLKDGLVASELEGFHTHDWSADPWSRGAYSWVPVGGLGAPEAMCVPAGGVLYFGGEHTDTTGHWGTVHAALGSGLRAARQVLAG